jgi:hypothetical protein
MLLGVSLDMELAQGLMRLACVRSQTLVVE